jgi:hypothetical protein
VNGIHEVGGSIPPGSTKFSNDLVLRPLRLPQPPLPDNFLALVPCSLLVTETPGYAGANTGKIRLADPDGAVLYEQEWVISAGQA